MRKIFKNLLIFLYIFAENISSKTISKLFGIPFFPDAILTSITKFTLDEGISKYSIRSKLHHYNKNITYPYLIALDIIDSENSQNYRLSNCDAKNKIVFLSKVIEIKNNSEWSEIEINEINLNQPKTFEFFLSDCLMNNLKQDIDNDRVIPFKKYYFTAKIEIILKNSDDSHCSLEEKGILYPQAILTIIFFFFIIWNVRHLISFYKREDIIDYPVLMLNFSVLLEFFSFLLRFFFLLLLENYGTHSFILKFFSHFFGILSNLIFVMIILLVGWGWTINYIQLQEFEYFLPVLIIICIFHLFIGLFTIMMSERDYIFVLEGYHTGIIFEIFKIGIFIYFVVGVYTSLKLARQKIKEFFIKFIFFGTLYFIHFYCLAIFAEKFINNYSKIKFLVIMHGIFKMILGIGLLKIFTSKLFNSVSFKGKSTLPSGYEDTKFS